VTTFVTGVFPQHSDPGSLAREAQVGLHVLLGQAGERRVADRHSRVGLAEDRAAAGAGRGFGFGFQDSDLVALGGREHRCGQADRAGSRYQDVHARSRICLTRRGIAIENPPSISGTRSIAAAVRASSRV